MGGVIPVGWTQSCRVVGRGLQPVLKFASALCTPIKRRRDAVYLPREPLKITATPLSAVDDAIRALNGKKAVWESVSCAERADLLTRCLDGLPEVSIDAAKAATDAHGSYGSGIGEEQYAIDVSHPIGGHAMRADGQPTPVRIAQRNGQFIADVFPKGLTSTLFGDSRFEIWIQKGREPSQGVVYRRKAASDFVPSGRISLVLDILHKLICDDEVVIVKMNPQNAFLGVYVERALQPFFDDGYVKLVYGGISEGQHLCQHALIDNIHLTGSIHTFNQIVFNTSFPTEDSARAIEKDVTAELGCVTPAIVVPGDWTSSEMTYVANTIVAGLTSNSAHSCCALECLVVMEAWPQRSQFLTILKEKLNQKEQQAAWYKGSHKKFERFLSQFPEAVQLGQCSSSEKGDTHAWLLAEGLSPEQANTQEENWCGVLQEVVLPGAMDQIPQFLSDAVAFCNDQCWGSLSCMVVIDPTTQKTHSTAFDDALAGLKYGAITVNAPPMFGFLPASTWGAYPGNALWNVGSGNCMVHNTSLYDYPEKAICYAPWQLHPIPIWADITHKDAVIDAVMRFLRDPGLLHLIQVVIPALRSSV